MTTGRWRSSGLARYVSAIAICAAVMSYDPEPARGAEFNVAIGVTPEGVSCVLGGSIAGEIVAASRLVEAMEHAQDYTVVDLAGVRSTALSIGRPRSVAPDADCEDEYEQELALAPDDLGDLRAALLGPPDKIGARVRAVTLLDGEDLDRLRGDIRVYLDESGFLHSGVELSQAMRFDADGDGVEDVLINAINSQRQNMRRGEYALILLKDGASGRIVPLAEEITDETHDYPSLLWENTVVAVVDFDGDGAMELIVYGVFYYGDGWEVIRLNEQGGDVVLGCGCGG